MGTGLLTITLCTKLVALVTSSADSPPDGTSRTGSPCGRAIWVLTVLGLRSWPSQMRVVNSYMLLELLQSIVRTLCKSVQAGGVKVA